MGNIIDIISKERVANVFFNLYERWLDEHEYEDIVEYGKVLFGAVAKEAEGAVFLSVTKRPFGLKVMYDGVENHIFVKAKGDTLSLCCKSTVSPDDKQAPVIVSDYEYNEMSEKERASYTRPSFVYAHGMLEDDMHIDLFLADLKGNELRD